MGTFPSLSGSIRSSDCPFGDLAAEKDDLLIQSFVDLGYIDAVNDRTVSLFVGPKGAGKSAIVKYFLRMERYDLFTSLYEKNRLEGIFQYLHIENKTSQILDCLIEILLLITAVESLAKDNSLFAHSSWQAIEKHFGNLNIYFTINRKSSERKIEVSIPKLFSKFSLTSKPENQSLTLTHLQETIRVFKTSIKELPIKNKHIIFLDDLDEDYSKIDFAEFKLVLMSLLTNADKLNDINNNLHFVTMLRDDISHRLYDSNLGKIINRSKKISWGNTTEEVTDKFGKFISCRIKSVAPNTTYHSTDGWSMLFEECYGRAMEPWANLKPEKVIEKTMWRPRDVLQFMNALFINFRDFKLPTSRPDALKQPSYNTEKNYSEYFLRELADSAHVEINPIVDFYSLIKEYKKLDTSSFYFKDWKNNIAARLKLSEENALKVLEILFNHSAVGTYSEKHQQKWAYRGHYDEFDQRSKILTHAGLIKTLGLYAPEY